ncbi:Osmosensitive K+ channel histidine kinase KdpD [Actinokineospora spheciospongiae]|uniref:histidine kinase n=1 Tax=Actinokineospora spheciospongiae TaxID=909613 RepID=W7IUM3_9PSEU|nr:HAMP domain-containing sensor histidine kinase [Actinokineospora spheciospongiae]EWC60086.1 Osmosensitive K+ channel histidine kinase KdpD [Actinokineospora spheciospongiae]PWW65597.1 two-component system sensor histidine kinase MprB [Actinokineospora spheciospongiae]
MTAVADQDDQDDRSDRSQPRERVSLRSRITLLAALCVGGAVALVSLGAYFTVYRGLYQQVDDSLNERATALLRNTQAITSTRAEIPRVFLELTDIKFDVVDGNGQSALGMTVEHPRVGPEELKVAQGLTPISIRTEASTDTRILARPYPFLDNTALVLAQPLDTTKSTLSKLAVVLIVIGGSGIIVAALAGTAVARGGLLPVQRLTAATERVTRTGDLRPIPVSGDDELSRLTDSFNTMLGAVAESQERQRRLVADAGHELRTPLTSLRTNLELMLASEAPGAPALAPQDKADIQVDLRAQLDELTQLIGDLVELAREDAAPTVREHVELVEVVDAALDRARRRAGEVTFEVRLEPWHLIGHAASLERAVLNLLDNAVKFSPPGGVVRVELRDAGDGYAFVQVADAGPGISDSDLPHVFDRFYRSEEARTLPGSGLGLAIVKQAAERHGGSVFASRSADGGALMAMRLPGAAG